jgi:hypothetical protein
VNVTGLPALPAGGNNIGDVGIVIPANVIAGMATLPAGVNNIGDVDIATLPATVIAGMATLPAGSNIIGNMRIDQTTQGTTNGVQLKAGAAAVGSVIVTALSALVAGAAIVGKVGFDQTTPGTTNLVDATGGCPTAPTVYNVVMAAANTEYAQALPTGCHKFALMMQTNDGDFRVAFVSGKVAASTAPFLGFPAGSAYNEDGINANLTLYFASSMAGKIMQVVAW